jgi:hypothetical protein
VERLKTKLRAHALDVRLPFVVSRQDVYPAAAALQYRSGGVKPSRPSAQVAAGDVVVRFYIEQAFQGCQVAVKVGEKQKFHKNGF